MDFPFTPENLNNIECPVCGIRVDVFSMFTHLYANHPEFLMILMSVNNPMSAEQMFLEDDNSYEALSSLCESVGNHVVSTDPNTVSDVLSEDCSITCPICLENVSVILSTAASTGVRRLRACQHTFCDDCISKWLEQSKLCPVCKKDSTEASQIKLISESLNSIKSSLSPTAAPLSD